jgi:2-(1,2-epoxy-1,2-dihydrophenyl)acetyl-CoA isomerase
MTESVVLLDRPAPHVARLRINRPGKRNAIDHAVRDQMTQHLRKLLADAETRALVFGGVDGVFSAGGDVTSMAGISAEQARERMEHIHVLCRLIAGAPVPVVSAMEGFAAGAVVGLALLGDHIVAGPGTKVLFPFFKLGLVPDWGQVLTLPRRVGAAQARRLFTSGEAVSGDEAHRIGLVDTLVPDTSVMDTAVRRAADLALLPQEAFARMKQRMNDVSATLAEEFAREQTDQTICLLGDDFREGYDAFLSKRTADFIPRPGAQLQ